MAQRHIPRHAKARRTTQARRHRAPLLARVSVAVLAIAATIAVTPTPQPGAKPTVASTGSAAHRPPSVPRQQPQQQPTVGQQHTRPYVMGSNLDEITLPYQLDVGYAAHRDLPKLVGQKWFDKLPEGALLAQAEVDAQGRLTHARVDSRLPWQFKQAIDDVLADPVVINAAGHHNFNKIYFRVETDRAGGDNGDFVPRDGKTPPYLEFLITGMGGQSSIYQKAFAFRAAAEHEALHSDNDKWYGPVSNGQPAPKRLRGLVNKLNTTCGAISTRIIQGFVKGNLNETITAFEQAKGDAVKEYGPDIFLTRRPTIPVISPIFDAVSRLQRVVTMLRSGGISSFRESGLDGCLTPSLMNLTGITRDDDSAAAKALKNAIETSDDFANLDGDLILGADEAPYRCTNDGVNIQVITLAKKPLAAGHPWDDETEMGSTVASTEAWDRLDGPSSLHSCLLSLSPTYRELMETYIAEVNEINYAATPGVRQAIATTRAEVDRDFGFAS